jgi:hypothetical protein
MIGVARLKVIVLLTFSQLLRNGFIYTGYVGNSVADARFASCKVVGEGWQKVPAKVGIQKHSKNVYAVLAAYRKGHELSQIFCESVSTGSDSMGGFHCPRRHVGVAPLFHV